MRRVLPLICIMVGTGLVRPALAQQSPDGWQAQKCAAYAAAWKQALDFFGSTGLNEGFIAGNLDFLAGGCIGQAEICPQSSAELDIANALSLALINAGAASTFLPFGCPHPQPTTGGWSGPGL